MKKTGLSIACSLLILGFATGQRFDIGLQAGGSLYGGDLTQLNFDSYLKNANGAFGGFFRWNAGPAFSLKLGFMYTNLSGDDEGGINEDRQLSFRTSLMEPALMLEYQPFRFSNGRSNISWKPFLTGGVGFFFFDPETFVESTNQWVKLQPLGTEGQGLPDYNALYNRSGVSIPFGLGLKVTVSATWTFGFEVIIRKTFTDYLDDVGSTVVIYQDVLFGNGLLAAQLSNKNIGPGDDITQAYRRGGPSDDWYNTAMITVAYGLGTTRRKNGRNGRSLPCPNF